MQIFDGVAALKYSNDIRPFVILPYIRRDATLGALRKNIVFKGYEVSPFGPEICSKIALANELNFLNGQTSINDSGFLMS